MVDDADSAILPDGSGFFIMSMPLPATHWLYQRTSDGFTGAPPMPFRVEHDPARRQRLNEAVRAAAKYAIRASTRCGREVDFDPDAMVQNFVVGMLGYHTDTGLDTEAWGNPSPVPPPFAGDLRD